MNNPFYCELLCSNIENLTLINDFTIYREAGYSQLPDKVIGLEAYLKVCAWSDDRNDLVKIYLIKDSNTHEIVAYFGLKAGMLAANMNESLSLDEQQTIFKTEGVKVFPEILPGIEISHFAVNDKYRNSLTNGEKPIKYLGKYLYPMYIYPVIKDVGTKIGVHMVYLYAAGDETLVSYYRNTFDFQEFSENDIYTPLEPEYDNGCKFMYRRFYS
ncbi:MAG: hypothetical protein IJ619_10365 [Eubacterium sp.]|nr:hypothetical protein [Eubacterium sp.]